MQSIIWKLSALATVIGMGLTGVVYQQGGFSRPGAAPTAAVKAGGAPAPNVPGQKAPDGKSPPAEPAGDPFANAGTPSESTADGAAPQLDSTAEGLSTEATDFRSQTSANDATGARTGSRTKGRARNAPPVEEFANQGAPQTASEEAFSNGAENVGTASAPPRPGVVRTVDPELLEGSSASDQSSNALTEDDPFGDGRPPKTAARTSPRGDPARSTASRGRPGMNEPEDNALAQAPPAEQNAFDPGADASFEQRPPVPGKLRSKARSRLIEDSDPPGAAAVAPAAAEVVDSIAQQPQYGPAASQFPVEGGPQPQIPAGKNRPRIDDEDSFAQSGAAPAVAPAVTSGRQVPGPRTRPRGFPEDGTGVVEQPASIPPDGVQPIPKLNKNAIATDQEMPPAVAQGGRRRPNSLVDDGDEGSAAPQPGLPMPPSGNSAPVESGSRGREPEPEMTDSAISTPTQRRPSKYILEVDPTESAGGSVNQRPPSEAAASRTPNTQVIAVPKRLASNSAFPGTPTGNGGRPRVTIEKRAPATAYIGQPLIYQIVIRNVGNGVAQQVVVEDIVPDGVAMQGSIPQAELVAKKLSWKIGSLAAGEERKISVKVIPGTEGAVGSAATVNFVADPALYASTGEPDPIVPVTPVAGSPAGLTPAGGIPLPNDVPAVNRGANGGANGDVTLDIQGPKQVGVGQPFDVRFRLTNRTNQPVAGVMIRKTLPGGLQHQTRIQDLEYRVGTLGPAESRDVTMTLTAVQPGRAVSRVMILGVDGRVLQSQEFTVDAGAIGNQSNSADLPVTLQRLGNTRPPVNRPTAYANRVTNRGIQTVSALKVTETIPQGMEFVSAGDDGQYDSTTRQVVWNVARLDPKAATDLEISLIAKVKNPQANSVVVADHAGNQVQASAQIVAGGAPMLSVEVVPPTGPVQVGDPVVYEIRIANKGTEAVQQAAIRLSIPAELQLAKAGPLNFRQEGTDLVFEAIPALDPGRQALLTAEFVALAPGDARLRVQFAGAHMTNPVAREENLRIAAK